MSELKIFHNPGCSKSRRALELLAERGADFEIVEYLKSPLDRATIKALIESCDSPPADFVRRSDAAFKEEKLSLVQNPSVTEVVELLAAHPRLMQRPIVSNGIKTIIGRPPELILDLP